MPSSRVAFEFKILFKYFKTASGVACFNSNRGLFGMLLKAIAVIYTYIILSMQKLMKTFKLN